MARDILIFDLGGVLADLGHPARQMALELSDADFWHMWLGSPSVRAFENGRIAESEFLQRFSGEIGLDESPRRFLERLRRWRLQVYPEVSVSLSALRRSFDIALLSNTNPIHWDMVRGQDSFEQLFDHVFLSFRMRHSKPEPVVFEHVIARLNRNGASIVFLDDSKANVEAARQFGIDAVRVDGRESRDYLVEGTLGALIARSKDQAGR